MYRGGVFYLGGECGGGEEVNHEEHFVKLIKLLQEAEVDSKSIDIALSTLSQSCYTVMVQDRGTSKEGYTHTLHRLLDIVPEVIFKGRDITPKIREWLAYTEGYVTAYHEALDREEER